MMWAPHARVMEKARADAEDFLLRVRKGLIRHNPFTVAKIHHLDHNSKPVLWDESLEIPQGIWGLGDGAALWHDPGLLDNYVVPLLDIMDAFWKSKVVQGSFIWAWSDDMFLVPGRGSEYDRGYDEGHGVDRIYHQDGKGLVGDAQWRSSSGRCHDGGLFP